MAGKSTYTRKSNQRKASSRVKSTGRSNLPVKSKESKFRFKVTSPPSATVQPVDPKSIELNTSGTSIQIDYKRNYEQMMRNLDFFDKRETSQSSQTSRNKKANSKVAKKKSKDRDSRYKPTEGTARKPKSKNTQRTAPKKARSRAVMKAKSPVRHVPKISIETSTQPALAKQEPVKIELKVEPKAAEVPAAEQQQQQPPINSKDLFFKLNESQMLDMFKAFLRNVSQAKLQMEAHGQPKMATPTVAISVPATSGTPAVPTNADFVTDASSLEDLHDELSDLLTNTNTIRDSYESIVQSLVNLQKRHRTQKASSLLPRCTSQAAKVSKGGEQECADVYDMENYQNVTTRENAFKKLFAMINSLKSQMEPFSSCFTAEGYLDEAKYGQHRITQQEMAAWKQEIRGYHQVVDNLLQKYNKDVLELFRLHSTMPSEAP